MDDPEEFGWSKLSTFEYRHYCGAKIAKSGRLWTAVTVDRISSKGHINYPTALAALYQSDPMFWTHGQTVSFGAWGTLWNYVGYLNKESKDLVSTFYVLPGEEFPIYMNAVFKRHYVDKAICVRCNSLMTELRLRTLPCFYENAPGEALFVICNCGHPVWHVGGVAAKADDEFRRTETAWRRKENLRTAGGKHSKSEIKNILVLQENRCIYCNITFSIATPATRDHLLPAVYGGSNWALNIVMSCRKCNSRRAETPFRSYCKLLSPSQNQKILQHLKRRILALDLEQLSREAFLCFCTAIELHNPRDWRYQQLYRTSSIARRNASINKLLPPTALRILKKQTKPYNSR